MDEPREILTIYIGNSDIFEWATDRGKSVLMSELLVGCEELLYNELNEVKCLRVESFVRGKHMAYDFSIYKDGYDETLEKIMDWALENEEYEMCQRVTELKNYTNEKWKFQWVIGLIKDAIVRSKNVVNSKYNSFPYNYEMKFLYIRPKIRYILNKNPAKSPPKIIDFSLLDFSFSKGKIGVSINWIKGVSFLNVIFANSN